MFMNNNILKNQFLQALSSRKCGSWLQQLNFILYKSTQHQEVFISQRVLGSIGGVRREASNRIMGELHQAGLIEKIYREWTSCIYKINPLFYVLADQLKDKFPALKIVCRKRLLSAFVCASFANRTPILEEEDYYNNHCTTIAKIDHQKWYIDPNINIEEEKEPPKGRSSMETSKPTINALIKRISSALNLTEYGELKLLVLPNSVLQATFEEYLRCKDHPKVTHNPFLWFLKYAKEYTTQHNISCDWSMWYTIKKVYNVPDNPVWFHPKKLNTITPYHAPEIINDREKDAQIIQNALQNDQIKDSFYAQMLKNVIQNFKV